MAFSTVSGTFQAGDTVYIEIQTTNRTVSPPSIGNVNLATISIIRPDGTLAVNGAAMTSTATGTYGYTFGSVATDQIGNWQASFVANATVNGVSTNSVLSNTYVFTLVQ
jgi:hypothetical protein